MNEEIAGELNRIANLQGKTFYSLINEIALAAIDAFNQGFLLREAVDAKSLLDKAKRSRLLLVNQDLWYLASDLAYRRNKDEWMSQVYEKAKWYGRAFLDITSKEALIESFEQVFKNLFWDCSELAIEQGEEETFSLRAYFVPEMPLQHTSVVLRTVEGMLNASGYAILKYTIEPGYLAFIFRRVPLPDEVSQQGSSNNV